MAVAVPVLPVSSAAALDCSTFRKSDAQGFLWDADSNGDGSVDDGTNDAYDGYGYFTADGSTYSPDDSSTCSYDENPSEFVFSPEEDITTGVRASRKLYVSQTGAGFARWLDVLENTTGAPLTVDVIFDGNLGSDGGTTIISSADGNTTADAGESWVTTDDSSDNGPYDPVSSDDPAIAHIADGAATAGKRVSNDGLGIVDGVDNVTETYTGVTIPAGGRVIFMHIEAQREKRADADAAAKALSAGPLEVFAQMTTAEGADVVNWAATDFDGDGVGNATDNCLNVANPGQGDADKDGQGDACDADADNDGLSNTVEAAIGTDPLKSDTDGDGVSDAADRCPTTGGDQANGCTGDDAPPTVTFVSPVEGTKLNPAKPATLAATAADDKGVAKVVFVDDGKVIGEDTTAPYSLGYQPKGEDVGRNTLAAIAIDNRGQTATAFRSVESNRFRARKLTSKTTPKSDTTKPFRFTTRGKLQLPAAVGSPLGCAGKVAVTFKAGKKTVSTRRATVKSDCSYRSKVTFSLPERLTPGRKLSVVTRFAGNSVVKGKKAKRQTVTAGT